MIAAALAVVLGTAGLVIYLSSDIRAVHSETAAALPVPRALSTVPQDVRMAWEQPTDPAVGAVASPYGAVVTTDAHAVTGRDASTGDVRWSVARTNRELCAIGSGDTAGATTVTDNGRVRGVVAIYARDGFCAEMVLLDPATGERRYQRTAPNELGGTLIFGGPYAAWFGSDRLELWRNNNRIDGLVTTHQYGNQPAPPKANSQHQGCRFLDAAVTAEQFATLEKCPAQGENIRLAINWSEPKKQNKDWSPYRSEPRGDVDTGSRTAKIVGITRDRVAVVVGEPTPALVIYDADGTVVSRSAAPISAATILGATGITPRTTIGAVSYALVGPSLLAVGRQQVTVSVTVTPTTTATATGSTAPATTAPGTTAPSTTEQNRDSPDVRWTFDGALGLPAAVGDSLLVPTPDGLAVVSTDSGTVSRTLAVDRSGDGSSATGRVDVQVVGTTIVEVRSSRVVALEASSP